MLTFKYVYDSQSSTKLRDQLTEMAGCCFNLETFDINHYKERKKAFKIKGSCSARENPFLAVYDNDLLVKAFYTEADECKFEVIIKWFKEYSLEHAKKGYMVITKIEGINNARQKVGFTESGVTPAFTEGLPLVLDNTDRWYTTSNIMSIDWNKKIFKTKNSIYSFTLNESTSN